LKKDIKEGRLKYDTNNCHHLLKTSEDNCKVVSAREIFELREENDIVEYAKCQKRIHQEHHGRRESQQRLRITFAPYAQIVTQGANVWVSTHVTTKSVAHRALWCKRV
jgi:hypothetical protein